MFGVTSDGTRHPAAPIALAATSVPSRISARLNTRLYPSSERTNPKCNSQGTLIEEIRL